MYMYIHIYIYMYIYMYIYTYLYNVSISDIAPTNICRRAPLVISTFVSTVVLCAWTRPSWISQTRKFAHAQNGGWRPHKELAVPSILWALPDHDWSCSFRRSPTTLRGWLMFASAAFFWIIFSAYWICFALSCLHICNSLSAWPLFVIWRSHHCAWGSAIKRPQTRSAAVRHWPDLSLSVYERDLVTNEQALEVKILTEHLRSFVFSLAFRQQRTRAAEEPMWACRV